VFSLARLAHAGKPSRERTQFPISTDAGRYFTKGRNQVRPLDGMHRQVIRRLQPYQYGTAAPDHSLAVLNRLSNQDKHRLLITTALVLEGLIVRTNYPGGGVKAIPNYMRESDEVKKMKLDPKVSLIVPVQLQVKDGRKMRDVFETLPVLGNDIRDILDWFRPVF
jgi:hypothetical protein